MAHLLLQFGYLQVLDVLTTLAFLAHGVEEANPIVRFFLEAAPAPLAGLVVVKLVGMALALYCWRRGRRSLLARVNVFYAALVAWNVMAIVVSAGTA